MPLKNGRLHIWLPVACVVALFGYHLFSQLQEFCSTCERGGDFAVLLLNVERANRFQALVGPYSRYGLAHPGPVVFYWYALFEGMLHGLANPMGAAMIAQIAMNALFAVAVVAMISMNAERKETSLILFGLMITYFGATRSPFLHYIWNPAVLLFPCAALLISSAVVVTKRSWFMVVGSLAALVMSHHHIAGAAFAGSLLCITTLLVFFRRGFRELFTAQLLMSVLILLIGSVPIAIDAFSNRRFGNLGRIYRHIFRERETVALFDAVEFLARLMTPLQTGGWVGIMLLGLLFLFPWIARLEYFERYLRLIATTGLLLGIYIVRGMHELTYDYLVWFLLSLSAVQSWLVLVTLFQFGKIPGFVSGFLGAVLSFVASFLALPQPTYMGGFCEPAGERIVKLMQDRAVKSVKVEFSGPLAWGVGSSLVNNLMRNKIDVCIQKRWDFMFGKDLICGDEASSSTTSRIVLIVALSTKNKGKLLYQGDQYSVFEKTETNEEDTSVESQG